MNQSVFLCSNEKHLHQKIHVHINGPCGPLTDAYFIQILSTPALNKTSRAYLQHRPKAEFEAPKGIYSLFYSQLKEQLDCGRMVVGPCGVVLSTSCVDNPTD